MDEKLLSFANLDLQSDCDCLQGAENDLYSTFAIKINNLKLTNRDFKSKWNKAAVLTSPEDCRRVCGEKGVSMSKVNSDNCMEVIEIYKAVFKISPAYKPYFALVALSPKSGKIKHTRSKRNPYHHDLYKSDSFDCKDLIFLGSGPLHY